STPEPAAVAAPPPGGEQIAEVGIDIAAPATPGSTRRVTVIADQGTASRAEAGADITVAEPGWTMWMVSHFHYDPVWWSTQGQFQRAEHQPDLRRVDHPQRGLRHRLPARRAGRRSAHRVDAGRLRLRPGLSGADGGRGDDRVVVGQGAVPPVGPRPDGRGQPA